MADALDGKLNTFTYPIDDLVELVRTGEIRVPSFQRGLRWGRSDVIKLFDSIIKGYPIGNFLLWRRPAPSVKAMRIGALQIDSTELQQALYVVDGQQRLTSLANALTEEGHQDPRFALAFDVNTEKFVPSNPGHEIGWQIPLPIIFDLTRLLRWYGQYPELLADPNVVERSNRVAKKIREFRVPVYIVEQSDPEVLRDIFDRMNNYGKQLTRAEVFAALHESGSKGTESRGTTDLGEISELLHAQTGFGVIDENTILLATLGRRGPNISRDIREEFRSSDSEFRHETADEANLQTLNALVLAVRFLQSDAAVPHFAFLPYRYLLVVLTRFFSHFPTPELASIRNLRRWFWRAATLGPEVTRGNITYATRSLCAKIIPGQEAESVAGLLELVGRSEPSLRGVKEFRTNFAESRLLLGALWANKPRDLWSADVYTTDDLVRALAEGSTAAPQAIALFRGTGIPAKKRALAGNRLFLALPESEVPEQPIDRLQMLISGFGEETSDLILKSHFIDTRAQQLLSNNRIEDFIEHRQIEMMSGLRMFLSTQAEWALEDTPPISSLIMEDPRDDEMYIDGE